MLMFRCLLEISLVSCANKFISIQRHCELRGFLRKRIDSSEILLLCKSGILRFTGDKRSLIGNRSWKFCLVSCANKFISIQRHWELRGFSGTRIDSSEILLLRKSGTFRFTGNKRSLIGNRSWA
ncbi:uncharacterized protein LOC117922851 isoform X3 [Vitis riparia]|uniref:uncharacterized protein LOC117922851 isoform X3 n=1 Tax=Vitis riparia TaxID=96939 RepID=UPI00155B1E0C|nr:uncharacterized protein LOC117922851 isoform X3 [Vitis riparia]